MTLAPTELARRLPDAIAYRHDPLRLSLGLADLVAADGHTVDVYANVGVRVVERPADLELFREQFLDSSPEPRVSLDDVRNRLAMPLRASLVEFVARHDAAACVRQRQTIAALLLERANEIGFACGIEFIAPIDVTVQSESLAMSAARARVHEERQRDAEQSARIAAILHDVPAHLLPADQQAQALSAILHGAAEDQAIYVVAGPELAMLDPIARRLIKRPVTADVGPLRCARAIEQAGRPIVAVGGQRGVGIVGGTTYAISAASERGFNSIALHAPTQRLVATHGELGLVTWNTADPSAAPETFAVAGAPRHLISLDERLIFATGSQMCAFDGQAIKPIAATSASPIVALLQLGTRLVSVRESGRVDVLDPTTLLPTTGFDHAPVTAAATLTAGGLQLLALAHADGEIDLLTLRGEPVAQLRSPYGTVRMLAAAGRYAIAVTPNRGTLLLFNLTTPAAAPQAISAMAPLGHRVADIAIAPREA